MAKRGKVGRFFFSAGKGLLSPVGWKRGERKEFSPGMVKTVKLLRSKFLLRIFPFYAKGVLGFLNFD